MATLFQSTKRIRKFVLVFLFISFSTITWGGIAAIFETATLVADPEANRFFMPFDPSLGAIPSPDFQEISYNSDARFEQISQHFQIFPDVSFVYSVERPRQKLLSVDRAEQTVQTLGFDLENRVPGATEDDLIWRLSDNSKNVSYNKVSQKWELTTNFRSNQAALNPKSMVDLDSYISNGRGLIDRLGFNAFGFESPILEAVYVTLGVDGVFRETNSQLESNYVYLGISKQLPLANLKPRDQLPFRESEVLAQYQDYIGMVYSDDPRFGQIQMTVSNNLQNISNDIFELNYTDYSYDQINTGIYPILTPDEAWARVQQGNGSLVFIHPQGENYYGEFDNMNVRVFTADFRQTRLGFYEPNEWTGYVTPIYIFTGSATLSDGRLGEFKFYIDAVKRGG